MKKQLFTWVPLAIVITLTAAMTLAGEDGPPAFNHLSNLQRTGFTSTELPPPYHRVWTYKAQQAPRAAWREPAWETQRIDMDYAYPLAADANYVFVASSSDHALTALDLKTGQPAWKFFTEGPLRLAPTVDNERVYLSSDDGYVYCLQCRDGKLIWKYRPDIPHERLVGNEQIINRWPARSGVLVDGDRAYTTFGMWSTEGIVITCLNSKTGEVVWQNDSSGTRYMTQPHYEAMGGVSPQGYLAMCNGVLVVPCGRAAPAFFDAATGQFLYNEAEGLFPGGAWTMTFGEYTFTPCEFLKKPNPETPEALEAEIHEEASLVALKARTGEEVFHLHGALWGVIDDDGNMSLVARKKLVGIRLQDVLQAAPSGYEAKRGSSEGHFVEVEEHQEWETSIERVFALTQAGSTLIAGGRGTLACYKASNGEQIWNSRLDHDVRDLLIANKLLLVSTSGGEIHCYRSATPVAGHQLVETPIRTITPAKAVAEKAEAVLAESGVDEGYALAVGDFDVDTLVALANASDLVWHWATRAQSVDAVRQQLSDAGLYGSRIVVHNLKGQGLPYADYCMNLVLFDVQSKDHLEQYSFQELFRVTRPSGGKLIVQCGDLTEPVLDWFQAGNLHESLRRSIRGGFSVRRGTLPGAGAWTHQYADAGKSGASRDQRVRLPLKTLWFGGLGPADIISRHYRTPAPLAINGRMFVAGIDYLHAIDAYNGRVLWERELPGVGRWPAAYRGGSIAADDNAVYALQNDQCLRLDAATGKTLMTYGLAQLSEGPASDANAEDPYIWEYLAVTDDVIVGTVGRPHIRRSWWSMAHPANRFVFVLDKQTGKTRWTYPSESAVDSSAIAIYEDNLFLIDGLATAEVFRAQRRGQTTKQQQPRKAFSVPGAAHDRALKCFELSSGRMRWESKEVGSRQNSLFVSNGVALSAVPIWHGLRARLEGPAISAFDVQSGKLLWSKARQRALPVIVNAAAYLPEAVNLRTGEPLLREDPITGERAPYAVGISGGCATLAGCEDLLMKRSGSMGFFDLDQDSGVYHFPNMRASCWINMIPACGLVLAPEGSSSCPCAYNYKTSLALVPADRENHWGLYTNSPRPKNLPLEKLCLNFGAPGDKPTRDRQDLWFAFPRPSTTGPRGAGGMGKVPYDALPMVTQTPSESVTVSQRNPDWVDIDDTQQPWLYSCSLSGPLELKIALGAPGASQQEYRVTIHFCELRDEDEVGTFDVLLQDKTVASNLDIVDKAGGRKRPLAISFDIQATHQLTLKLAPRSGAPPAISGLKIQAVR